MAKIYARKIKNHEINNATGAEWTIDDVPARWQDEVRALIEA